VRSSYNEKCFKQNCREQQNTHFRFSDFFSENHALYEIMFKNIVKPQRTKIIWRLRVAYWISKLTRASTGSRPYTHTHIHTRTHDRTRMFSPTLARAHTQKYIIHVAFCRNGGSANAPQCYFIYTLPVLLQLYVGVSVSNPDCYIQGTT
jgi:hypothetical protein